MGKIIGHMELILQGKDAADWVYRGEGAANLVLGYHGSSPDFVRKVLRVQKSPRSGPPSKTSKLAFSMHKTLLWREILELATSDSKEIIGQLYALHVMGPLLGSDSVDAGTLVHVSREFLELVEKIVHSQRPVWRVDAAKVNTLCDSALLISDHTSFPHGILTENQCITVEIKPKCGFLPSSRFIAETNATKKNITRFKMHQLLKLHKKEILRISEYDPLDLFSKSRNRIDRAIKALFTTPQNNFRIFLNGSLIFGGLGGGLESAEIAVGQASETTLEDLINNVIQADCGLVLESFLELVVETIFRSGILDRLLEAQKLDVFDIEGVIHSYYNVISQPCMVCKNLGDVELCNRYSFLHSLSAEESLKIVREYLIAATAKDCSLMISFRPRREYGGLPSECSSIHLESTNQNFDYKAYFIDLDMKPLEKMIHYYELDQKIVSFYSQMEEEKAHAIQ